MITAAHPLSRALLERARTLEHLLERHPARDLLARCEAVFEDGRVLDDEAQDLLRRLEDAIVTLEDEALA